MKKLNTLLLLALLLGSGTPMWAADGDQTEEQQQEGANDDTGSTGDMGDADAEAAAHHDDTGANDDTGNTGSERASQDDDADDDDAAAAASFASLTDFVNAMNADGVGEAEWTNKAGIAFDAERMTQAAVNMQRQVRRRQAMQNYKRPGTLTKADMADEIAALKEGNWKQFNTDRIAAAAAAAEQAAMEAAAAESLAVETAMRELATLKQALEDADDETRESAQEALLAFHAKQHPGMSLQQRNMLAKAGGAWTDATEESRNAREAINSLDRPLFVKSFANKVSNAWNARDKEKFAEIRAKMAKKRSDYAIYHPGGKHYNPFQYSGAHATANLASDAEEAAQSNPSKPTTPEDSSSWKDWVKNHKVATGSMAAGGAGLLAGGSIMAIAFNNRKMTDEAIAAMNPIARWMTTAGLRAAHTMRLSWGRKVSDLSDMAAKMQEAAPMDRAETIEDNGINFTL